MKNLFENLRQCIVHGEDSALVTVLAVSGSTPRSAGAHMLVKKDSSIIGTIGGGAVEHHVRQLAAEIIWDKKSFIREFEVAQLGMICGGSVEVSFQYIEAGLESNLSLVEYLCGCFERNEDAWLITDITAADALHMGVYSRERGLFHLEEAPEKLLPCLPGNTCQVKLGDRRYYIEAMVQAGRVYIFGGGHVAQALVPVLAQLDFRCIVIEDREPFADKALFPAAEDVILGDVGAIGNYLSIGAQDYVVVVTRGHQHDFSVTAQALDTDACYIGVIGSRKKIAATHQRLIEEKGRSEVDLARLHGPIGLPILAETPAEIAISIAAEMITVRAQLRKASGQIHS